MSRRSSQPEFAETHYFRFRVFGWNGTVVALRPAAGDAEARTILDQVEVPSVGASRLVGESWTDARTVAERAISEALHDQFGYRPVQGGILIERQRDDLGPGEHYPRIWRSHTVWRSPDYRPLRTDSKVALRQLDRIALEIFDVVEPGRNLSAFGHRTRQLLLLASMEVENALRSTLHANHVEPLDRNGRPVRFSTQHYIKLRDPMRLSFCRLRLPEYPTLDSFEPFANWTEPGTTESIPWYDAYNRTKHSRQDAFDKATLGAALNALSAAWILHAMQFGPDAFRADTSMWELDGPHDFFEAGDGYLFNLLGEEPTPRDFPFP